MAVGYTILDVIDTLGPNYYRAIIGDLTSQPMLALIQHSEVPSCADCKRFIGYYSLKQKPDGTLFYVYRRNFSREDYRPLYPCCKKGIKILLHWFTKEFIIHHTRIRVMRHGLGTNGVRYYYKAG